MYVLAWRMGFAGDILLSTASLEGIKRKYPKARLTYGVWPQYHSLIETNPHIDDFVWNVTARDKRKANKVWEISHESYNMAHGEMAYWGEIHARQAAGLNLLDPDDMASFKPQVFLSASDIILKPSGVKVAALGSFSTNGADARLWGVEREPIPPDLIQHIAKIAPDMVPRGGLILGQKWAELTTALGKMGFQTVQLGVRKDPLIPGVGHDLRGALTWRQSIGMLLQADLCVTIDTFLLHAALARKYALDGSVLSEGTPTVAILGPIDGRGLFPTDAECVVEVSSRLTDDCPCYHSSRFGGGPCEHKNLCMTSITTEMVLEGVEKCLNL